MKAAEHMQAHPRLGHTLNTSARNLTPNANNITITTSVVTKEVEEKIIKKCLFDNTISLYTLSHYFRTVPLSILHVYICLVA